MGMLRRMQHQSIEAGECYTETVYLATGWRCVWDFYTKDATVHFVAVFKAGGHGVRYSWEEIQPQTRVAAGEVMVLICTHTIRLHHALTPCTHTIHHTITPFTIHSHHSPYTHTMYCHRG
jgi:hypothetical protein